MTKIESLFPIVGQPRISSLARAADRAPLDSTGFQTEYRPLESRSILSKASRSGLFFSHAINPYRGCEFACRYCYARYAHEFIERTPEEFEKKIYFKQNAHWLLKQELARTKRGTQIALGTATDPYQPIERQQRLTRSLLEVFAATEGFGLSIVTKSALISRDVELLKEIARRHTLTIALTVTTVDTRLARLLEPRAPRPDLRMRTLTTLRRAGLRAGVLCSPLMPGITDSRSSIAAVARAAKEAGARFFGAGALFLKSCSRPTFFKFVEEHFPAQLAAYERRYGANAYVSPEYRKRVGEVVQSICREYKLGKHYEDMPGELEEPSKMVELQPWLPFAAGR